ncbi:3398_t:CDS:2, partial [Scutellospora calospora]
DRSNMVIAIVYMTLEFDFTSSVQGVILHFFGGYLTTQVLAAASWTLFTFLTSISAKVGACFPTVNSLISAWFPREETSKAVSTITSSAYIGIVIALLISTWLGSGPLGWPGIFLDIWNCWFDLQQKNNVKINLNYHRVESGDIVNESMISENNDTNPNTPSEIFVIEENSEVNELLTNNLKLPNLKQVPWKLILSRREMDLKSLGYYSMLPYATQGVTGIFA